MTAGREVPRVPITESAVHRMLPLPVLFFISVAPLGAQWRVALLSGSATSHGDSRNNADPDRPEFHAARPVTWTLALARDHGAFRVGVEVRRSVADLSEAGASGVIVSTRGAFEAVGTAVEVGWRIAGTAATAMLRGSLGVGADRWKFDLSAARWRPSARGALETDFPVGRHWSAVVRGELVAGPSVFNAAELPEGFERRNMWRTGMAVGVARTW